ADILEIAHGGSSDDVGLVSEGFDEDRDRLLRDRRISRPARRDSVKGVLRRRSGTADRVYQRPQKGRYHSAWVSTQVGAPGGSIRHRVRMWIVQLLDEELDLFSRSVSGSGAGDWRCIGAKPSCSGNQAPQ